jgi:hypothetical protein
LVLEVEGVIGIKKALRKEKKVTYEGKQKKTGIQQ